MSIANQLLELNDTKKQIKEAIISKGQSVGDNMTEYADAIRQILTVQTNYLTFTFGEGGGTLCLENYGDNNLDCKYSTDKNTWHDLSKDTANPTSFPAGPVYIKGNNPSGFSSSSSKYSCFVMTGSVSASGSVMSIIDEIGETTTIPCDYCFCRMFYNCTALTAAPDLPATTLAPDCYSYMFYGCNSLVTAPKLPATTLAPGCYSRMFYGCSSLVTAPKLPATTLADSCYDSMFSGCSSLVTAPKLPATALADSCYDGMFSGCSSLVTAPKLPATALTDSCYSNMFYGCSSLTTAPELPATTLAPGCYYGMFGNCSSLNYIKCLAMDVLEDDCYNWVWYVASTGTFVLEMGSNWPSGDSGIPPEWTVKYTDIELKTTSVVGVPGESTTIESPIGKLYERVEVASVSANYLNFKSVGDTESSVYLQNNRSNSPNCEYSFNGVDWITMPTTVADKITIPAGEKILVRGNNPSGFSTSFPKYSKFIMTGSISASGSVMSLIDGTGETTTIPSNYCFCRMFYNCSGLTTAPELPATTLAPNCYSNMFYGCSSLTTAPELPATTLALGCYSNMFEGCSSLTTAPELPDTALVNSCYYGMFYGCSSLTTAPDLPATTLAPSCYNSMFHGCSSLVTAPELPATALANSCYSNMFYGCSSLTTAPDLPATTLAPSCYYDMFEGCSSLTTAPELPATTLASDCYFYMFCGCSSLTTAPELPATALVESCYDSMFRDCSSLNYIKCLATSGINQNNSTSGLMANAGSKVTGTKTFVQAGGVTWPTGNDGIPSSWVRDCDTLMRFDVVPFGPSTVGNMLVFLDTSGATQAPNCEYSTNLITWRSMPTSSADAVFLDSQQDPLVEDTVANGIVHCHHIFVRGVNSEFNTTDSRCRFAFIDHNESIPGIDNLGRINASGSVMSLIDGIGEATTIPNNYCFFNMFGGCTTLTTAPELPATTLANSCYSNMFQGCSSLVTAPELPATTLTPSCYDGMFRDCSSLVTAPELPATTLAPSCYSSMFESCSSLTIAPELPATTLASYCYEIMFANCSSLTTVVCKAKDSLSQSAWGLNMLQSNYSGELYVYKETGDRMQNSSWIPASTKICYMDTGVIKCTQAEYDEWQSAGTLEKDVLYLIDYVEPVRSKKKLKMTCNDSVESSTVYLQNNGSNNPNCEYSFNGTDWITMPTTVADKITIPAGEKIFVRGNNPSGFSTSFLKHSKFIMTGSISASGSVMSLIDGTGETTTIPSNHCFFSMFYNCTALTVAPKLPATTLADSCYDSMFDGCSSLVTAPELPATTLASYCYSYMFRGCTTLTTAPDLPATTLASYCYNNMFQGCSSLNYIKCLATSGIDQNFSTYNWMSGVSSSGTFVKDSAATWPSGINGIPSGWSIQSAS